jgi:hypothetical protein
VGTRKTCRINFDYKTKLTGNRLSTPFVIDSKYSPGAQSGPDRRDDHITLAGARATFAIDPLGRVIAMADTTPGLMLATLSLFLQGQS